MLNAGQNVETLMKDMEVTAARMRELIVGMPPEKLFGYIYAQLSSMTSTTGQEWIECGTQSQFLLEYIHAVLATDLPPKKMTFSEEKCKELFKLSSDLYSKALYYSIISSLDNNGGVFGPNTSEIEFQAKFSWVTLRSNRYLKLEGEFYRYVLAPHDEVLKEVYGVDALAIASGFQAMADTTRTGLEKALMLLKSQYDTISALSLAKGKSLEEATNEWMAEKGDKSIAAGNAVKDLFYGGIANISHHTNLPEKLLADLAFQRGEDKDFFAVGDFSGTPYRTLPVRKKPLIKLGSDYFAVDPCFIRDAGYRSLLFNLLQHKPAYKTEFKKRQQAMSEAAFADILSTQLPSATVLQEIYYKDSVTKDWCENDTLILIDDMLYLIEAKSGAAATIASPVSDFDRHAQAVKDLIIKAYKQCERFFNYLNTAEEVPLFHITDGRYVECARIRRADYRVLLPIGLTVESFSPFSTFCKDMPQIVPLLGKHAFISLSIDDLFVLRRFLPTPGEFGHYMEVRQVVAGLRHAHLFDEMDHLGAYLKNNRFDYDLKEQLDKGPNFIIWDGMSSEIDRYFEDETGENNLLPVQEIPDEMAKLLCALDATRKAGWLSVESFCRNLGGEGRAEFANLLVRCRKSLDQQDCRYFIYGLDDALLFIWLQKSGSIIDWQKVNSKASAAALVSPCKILTGLMIETTANGNYKAASIFPIHRPTKRTMANAHIFEDAERMKRHSEDNARIRNAVQKKKQHPTAVSKIGRNAPCPCNSGLKYKKCHGR